MAKTKSKKKAATGKAPTPAQRRKIIRDAMRRAVAKAIENTQKAERMRAEAEKKAFAAQIMVHIGQEVGFSGPPMSVRKKVRADAKKKAAAAKKKAISKAAAAKKAALADEKRALKALGL